MFGYSLPLGLKRKVLRPVSRGGNYIEISLPEHLPERIPPISFFTNISSIHQVIHHLALLSEEKWIDGIILKLGQLQLGMGPLSEIYQALADLKKRGKRLIVYLNSGESSHYLLASLADLIVMNPAGSLFLPGFRVEIVYLRDTLKKIGVKPEFERIGRYKSAPEIFTRTSPSQPHQEEIKSILEEITGYYNDTLRKNRKLSAGGIKKITDAAILTAAEAEKLKLVDVLGFPDEIPRLVEELWKDKIVMIPGDQMPISFHYSPRRPRRQRLAVVFVEGTIRSGESLEDPFQGTRMTGADTLVPLLEQVAREKSIVGAVLRVDSGGGSADASDALWRAVIRLREKKPVVISCGGMAASGAYYLAAGASEIFSNPLTLTGSIGVFFGKFVIRDLLGKLGANPQIIKNTERADMLSSFRFLTRKEHALLRRHLEFTYRKMLERIGEGRNMKMRTLSQYAEGRVWTGTQALNLNLVDHLGGLAEAIRRVKELAGISPEEKILILDLPRRRSWKREILRGMIGGGYANAGSPTAYLNQVNWNDGFPGSEDPFRLRDLAQNPILSLFLTPQNLALAPYFLRIK
ncbi:MAG: signal peptide peptidase SppA [bacterium]|nr:signal peptide peptidase SppA [bacterium]